MIVFFFSISSKIFHFLIKYLFFFLLSNQFFYRTCRWSNNWSHFVPFVLDGETYCILSFIFLIYLYISIFVFYVSLSLD